MLNITAPIQENSLHGGFRGDVPKLSACLISYMVPDHIAFNFPLTPYFATCPGGTKSCLLCSKYSANEHLPCSHDKPLSHPQPEALGRSNQSAGATPARGHLSTRHFPAKSKIAPERQGRTTTRRRRVGGGLVFYNLAAFVFSTFFSSYPSDSSDSMQN